MSETATQPPIFRADELRDISCRIIEALGTPEDAARIVADSLVESNLRGHDSHGVLRLMLYADGVRAGQVKPAERPSVKERRQATAIIDGGWGWGQPAAHLAAQTVVELAIEFGVGAVTIQRGNHTGRLGEWAEISARAGMFGMVVGNGDPYVAPFGARERVMGTNPIAWAVPRASGHDPLLIDFATASVAEGKLRVARAKAEKIPLGLIVDRFGRPSDDPEDFYAGGALLPFGGQKGSGLALLIELIAGALSTMGPSGLPDYGGGNGTLMIALDIGSFLPREQFLGWVEALCDRVKDLPLAEGFTEILLPGEPELRARERRLREGISIPARTWEDIKSLASELAVVLPEAAARD